MSNRDLLLEDRTIKFSKDILLFCRNEPNTNITRPIVDQLIRSATSVGANYAEARNAGSKVDFRNKVYIAKKEAAEAKYWLTLMQDVTTDKHTCFDLFEECHYILMTLQKVVNTLNTGNRIPAKAR